MRNEAQLPDMVREFTQGAGADVVIDHVGAATWEASLACLAIGGRMVLLGNTSGDRVSLSLRERVPPRPAADRRGRVHRAGLRRRDHRLRSPTGARLPIAGEYPLDELPAAWAAVESRDTVGKVVVSLTTAARATDAPAAGVGAMS